MALAGLEPARGYPQQILNLPRLPIPPQSHGPRGGIVTSMEEAVQIVCLAMHR